ncbi:putative AMP-dependent synthetase/ligase, acetyl-coenzyme A synthetase domain-containing protein [Plasmopara halstedii]
MLRVLSLGQRFLVRRIQFSKYRAIASYAEQYRRSLDKPEEFWAEAAQDIEWFKPWSKVLDTPVIKMVHRGEMNTCYNALDVHVNNGRGDVPALHYDSPLTSTKTSITYGQLLKEVLFLLAVYESRLNKGDRVVIYMPAVLETTVAMLACARLGAVHSVVFGGFAISELAARIDDATPKLIISGSCGVEPKGIIDYGPLLNGALERSTWKPSKVVMLQRDIYPFLMTKGRDVDWRDVMAIGDPVEAVPLLATDPLYILYTSDTFFAASDMGWTVGHSLVVYGPLIHGCTSVQYAGKPVGTPDAGVYWRLITEYGIKSMFTAPTALRAIRMDDPQACF